MSPINIVVLHESEEVPVEGVKTWWYDKLDLKVEYASGETATFPGGNVIRRF